MQNTDLKNIGKLLFEAAMLKQTMRTGYAFLGSGKESTAAHCFGTAFIALLLGKITPGANIQKLVLMALIHDLPESRTGDLNAVHKLYVKRDELTAFRDAVGGCCFANEFMELYKEFEKSDSLEAKLVKDADQLDMLLSLKKEADCGNPNAGIWIPFVKRRLMTEQARTLSKEILELHWSDWWMEVFKDHENNKRA